MYIYIYIYIYTYIYIYLLNNYRYDTWFRGSLLNSLFNAASATLQRPKHSTFVGCATRGQSTPMRVNGTWHWSRTPCISPADLWKQKIGWRGQNWGDFQENHEILCPRTHTHTNRYIYIHTFGGFRK